MEIDGRVSARKIHLSAATKPAVYKLVLELTQIYGNECRLILFIK